MKLDADEMGWDPAEIWAQTLERKGSGRAKNGKKGKGTKDGDDDTDAAARERRAQALHKAAAEERRRDERGGATAGAVPQQSSGGGGGALAAGGGGGADARNGGGGGWCLCRVLLPSERLAWDLFLFGLLGYVATAVPYRLCFGVEATDGW